MTKSCSKGFSLIEVLITMTVVTIGMMAIGSFYFSSVESERTSQERLVAVHLAEQIIEDWQKFNVYPTPSCTVGGVAAAPLVEGVTTTCVLNSSVSVPFDILITESQALAPIPYDHLKHSKVTTNPEMGILLTVPTDAASAPVLLRAVKITWNVKQRERSVLLTHIQRKI